MSAAAVTAAQSRIHRAGPAQAPEPTGHAGFADVLAGVTTDHRDETAGSGGSATAHSGRRAKAGGSVAESRAGEDASTPSPSGMPVTGTLAGPAVASAGPQSVPVVPGSESAAASGPDAGFAGAGDVGAGQPNGADRARRAGSPHRRAAGSDRHCGPGRHRVIRRRPGRSRRKGRRHPRPRHQHQGQPSPGSASTASAGVTPATMQATAAVAGTASPKPGRAPITDARLATSESEPSPSSLPARPVPLPPHWLPPH